MARLILDKTMDNSASAAKSPPNLYPFVLLHPYPPCPPAMTTRRGFHARANFAVTNVTNVLAAPSSVDESVSSRLTPHTARERPSVVETVDTPSSRPTLTTASTTNRSTREFFPERSIDVKSPTDVYISKTHPFGHAVHL